MERFKLDTAKDRPFRILCLGAHCDDIEIGCGGSILKMIGENQNLSVFWVVFSSDEQRKEEAAKSASLFLKDAREKTVIIEDFRNSFFPYTGTVIKEYFESLKSFSPDLIFTHYRHDLHQDHALISKLTWNTFRNHLILEYEIPKYDGDLSSPNCFFQLDEPIGLKKINYIMECFLSQKDKPWCTEDAFLAIMRIRGVESNSPEKFSEGFYCRKLIM